ncbi:DUF3221 domain-containing protein [Pontibacter fetidus]|uniref:DUF3221 domain-containing protein n=1 Tax=Pontibacter fetidus TaxID=2700082 RepID=A0A6B2GW18_9BACT|nr:DUF3221 domain-containing protein [Pontibacter fetidus]NDK55005.1 DUF3221 domain-containing protein [Pontibacter fetidus]
MDILLKILAYSLGLLLLVACRGQELKRMPDTLPDINGKISSLTQTATTQNNTHLQLLVEAPQNTESAYAQASVKVDDDTLIEDKDGKRLKAGQLKEGQHVEVWFNGAVRESMPVQATAVAIRVGN